MQTFKLDSRLANDCYVLQESKDFVLLLMNNSLVPWFILVPKTEKTEIYELDILQQTQLWTMINKIAQFVKLEFKADKLNIAALGNIVKQLHIHIIVRYKTDVYWPGVVWGASEKESYKQAEINKIKLNVNNILEF